MLIYFIKIVLLLSTAHLSASSNSSRCSSTTSVQDRIDAAYAARDAAYNNNSTCSSPHTEPRSGTPSCPGTPCSGNSSPSTDRSQWHPGWREIDGAVLQSSSSGPTNSSSSTMTEGMMQPYLVRPSREEQESRNKGLENWNTLVAGLVSGDSSRSNSGSSSPTGWPGTQTPPRASTQTSTSGSNSPEVNSSSRWKAIHTPPLRASTPEYLLFGNTSPQLARHRKIVCPQASRGNFGDGQRNQARNATKDAERRQFKNGPKDPISNSQSHPHNQYPNQTYTEGDHLVLETKKLQHDLKNDINQLKQFIKEKNQVDSGSELGWQEWAQDTCAIL